MHPSIYNIVMQNIVIFGGVFDPPHLGHLSIYKAVTAYINVDKFIIVPSKNPPLKSYKPTATAIDRINMLKQMFKQYKNVSVDGYEALQKSNNVSYTINTLRYFHTKYPKAQLYIVVGTDRYIDFKE
jgi:nicotinate-nucleotide adenylyltransferase